MTEIFAEKIYLGTDSIRDWSVVAVVDELSNKKVPGIDEVLIELLKTWGKVKQFCVNKQGTRLCSLEIRKIGVCICTK